ncbi:hypothetical protein D3C75_1067970 [compost metagenome]
MQLAAPGFQVHHPVDRAEIQQGRNERGLRHFGIGYVDGLGHDERHRAHDRWHQLAAHACGRLHATGKCRLVAEALHQRDGELPGGDHVRYP